ncbi:MAG TPA: protein translocase subunit SecF [Candidatus Solibacter sp.]|nr:protein translocase subunit SecF [Candidatus Solibacter sp.]
MAGVLSMLFWHGIPWGVEFRGGTLVYVKFSHTPDLGAVRAAMDHAGLKDPKIQTYGSADNNEVLIDLAQKETNEQTLDQGKRTIINALEKDIPAGKQDLNNASLLSVKNYLIDKDPLHVSGDDKKYAAEAQAMVDYRDKTLGGVLKSIDDLKPSGASAAAVDSLKDSFFLSDFRVRDVQIVGPQVGAELQKSAALATMYSLAGMLVYLGFRFEWIYGVAAVVTVFHDTLITVGAFSLLAPRYEISLTVIAAILTLIGYSNNDTIVVFDRIRENIKLMRREKLSEIVNRSINQTLSRTILTAGLTFLTVLALFLFGGEVLHGFSLALVIGILIGTYSSIAIAAPILVAYQDWRIEKGKRPVAMPVKGKAR